MLYLATPYSHENPAVVQRRFSLACAGALALMRRGEIVFSPIAHSHPVSMVDPSAQFDHGFWMAQDLAILRRCSGIVVLMLDGWDRSKGVQMEIEYARTWGIPIAFMSPEEVGL